MAYTELLNEVINQSGLTVKEIAERCTANGVKVTAAYISTLRNDTKNRTPSDEMSRAIAKACGWKDENALVIEAYIDNAPPEFKGVFDFIREMFVHTFASIFENSLTEDAAKAYKEQLERIPMCELIRELGKPIDSMNFEKQFGTMNMSAHTESDGIKAEITAKQAVGFDVTDDSMYPTMPKGSKATLEYCDLDKYKDGDILAYIEKNTTALMYRKAAFLNEQHTQVAMFPMNSDFQTKTYNVEDITILGKVTQVITKIS